MSPRSVSEDSFTSSIALIYADYGEPTSGLEPLTCSSYECAVKGCLALHTIANLA